MTDFILAAHALTGQGGKGLTKVHKIVIGVLGGIVIIALVAAVVLVVLRRKREFSRVWSYVLY